MDTFKAQAEEIVMGELLNIELNILSNVCLSDGHFYMRLS